MSDSWFDSAEGLKAIGFTGFINIRSLRELNLSQVPKSKGDYGVYVVLRREESKPVFTAESSGGRFKGRDPNVAPQELEANWVDRTPVMYVGKAGSSTSSATLRSRLKQYLDFGNGKRVGHWGGRYLWHLPKTEELIICWKTTLEDEPRRVEAEMIQAFKAAFGQRPFANLVD